MKVVTAIDSFKGSMTSMEAGFAAAEGIHRVDADAEVQVRPLADGGEGTVEALVAGMNGKTEHVKVTGPLGEPVICEYGIIESTKTAVIEMAGAAGITQVPDEKRNPLYTTTYGVGEVIKDAIEKGCRRFIVGIGGSATNDGGVGMLQALGYAFLDKDGKQVTKGRMLDFMGFQFHHDRTTIRKSNIEAARRKANHISKQDKISWYNASVMLSYMGLFKHTDTYNYYIDYIKPKINVKKLKRIVSKHSRKENEHDRLEKGDRNTAGQAGGGRQDIVAVNGLPA